MENPMNTTINKNQTWCSMWGNAVSIAEHRPESYAKISHSAIRSMRRLMELL